MIFGSTFNFTIFMKRRVGSLGAQGVEVILKNIPLRGLA